MEVDGKIVEEKLPASKWFTRDAHWIALFVRTGNEDKIVVRLQRKLDIENHRVFVPTRDFIIVKKNEPPEMRRTPWLTGYVFIASFSALDEIQEMVGTLISNDPTIYKLLTYDKEAESIELAPSDKTLMSAVLNEDFHFEALPAVIIDGRVHVDASTIEKYGGRVVKVDKRNRKAMIELALMGRVHNCEIALEIAPDLDRMKR